MKIFDILKALAANAAINKINEKLKLANSDKEKQKLKAMRAKFEKDLKKKVKKRLDKKLSSGMTLSQVIARDMVKAKKISDRGKKYKFSLN